MRAGATASPLHPAMNRFLAVAAGFSAVAVAVVLPMARAANPLTNLQFTADPSGHVFDGRLYVYPSHDRNDAQEFDMTDYHVYSTDDLQNWQDHGVALDLADIPWARQHLWAPDCVRKDGTYYFYFPANPKPGGGSQVGVATGASPAGPFKPAATPIAGVNGIDPAVFVDDDGQAYIYWAGAGPQAARLKPSMTELDGEPVKLKGADGFFEGPWVFKRQGTYYFTYPAKMKGGSGDGGHGQWFDYATGDNPLGPFTYRGHFTRSGPGGGNIHGSQVEWQGKWYCLYHDFSTSEGQPKRGFKRAMRLDEMTFAPDGSIEELRWTADGPPALRNLDPYTDHEAACLHASDLPLNPHAVTTVPCSAGGVALAGIGPDDWVRYANVDFGTPDAAQFTARVAALAEGGQIELRLDRPDGPLAGTCVIPATGGWETWQEASCGVEGASGVRALYLRFTGPAGGGPEGLFRLKSWRFAR